MIEKLWEDPYAHSFRYPVDTETYDDYLDVVETPMCLQDILNKLDAEEYKMAQLSRFAMDVRQIWTNCKIYNLHKSQIWYCAHTLSLLFERLFQAWVLAFSDGSVPMSEPLARPWENSCRSCQREDGEENMLLCDHCDAPYHIFCLSPPLPAVPEDPWICSYCAEWLKGSGAKCLSSTVEEEARQMTANAKERRIQKVRRKKYLVKWRGLSYRECTWESAKDINDDQAIAEYHRLNDTPPEEPPLTQAEIGAELAKDRKNQMFPAMRVPNLMRDTEAAIYSQIRAYHFLRFNQVPPAALLKECGSATYAYAHGARIDMLLPASTLSTIDQIWSKEGGLPADKATAAAGDNVDVSWPGGAETKDGEDSDEEVGDTRSTEGLTTQAAEEEESIPPPSPPPSQEKDDEELMAFRQRTAAMYRRKFNAEEAADAIEAAVDAFRLARRNKTAAGKEELSVAMYRQGWYRVPSISTGNAAPSQGQGQEGTGQGGEQDAAVRSEVCGLLGDMVQSVSRTTPLPCYTRPPLRQSEVEVCVAKGSSGLYMNIGDFRGCVVVLGFRKMPNGAPGPAEATGKIKVGDLLVGINGVYVAGLSFKDIISLLSTSAYPYLYMRLLRLHANEQRRLDMYMKGTLSGRFVTTSSKPLPPRCRYFGVRQLSTGHFRAEVVHDYNTIVVGDFENEEEAARARDSMVLKLSGSDLSKVKLNFQLKKRASPQVKKEQCEVEGGLEGEAQAVDSAMEVEEELSSELTRDAKALALSVQSEHLLTEERLRQLEESFVQAAKSAQEAGGDANGGLHSEDSLDSDSALEESSQESEQSVAPSEGGGSSESSDDDDDWGGSDDKDDSEKEWRPREEMEAGDGPMGRLVRAVNESDYAPFKSEWQNYVVELGMRGPGLKNATDGTGVSKKVEQIDLASGVCPHVASW